LIQSLANSGDVFDENDANIFFNARINSLQAADELVEDLIQTLESTDQLENTYIFFVSDNGFHLGEHSLPSGKGTPYEEDIRVPLMVRGPNIAPGTVVNQMSANIDLAPTIAEIAGVDAPDFVDGRSFLPCLTGKEVPWRDGLLIEFGYIDEEAVKEALADPETDNLLVDVAGGAFRAIRGLDYVYVEYVNGEIEFYDLVSDPYQLENIAVQLSAETLEVLHTKLEALKYCEDNTCRTLDEDLNLEIQN
jgi:arylsulfatase A-like enzyme